MFGRSWKTIIHFLLLGLASVKAQFHSCDSNSNSSWNQRCLSDCTYCLLNSSRTSKGEVSWKSFHFPTDCNPPQDSQQFLSNEIISSTVAICRGKEWRSIPLEFSDLALNDVLVLDENNIDSLNEADLKIKNQTLFQVRFLSIGKNFISNITKEFFRNFSKLEVLILGHNGIVSLRWCFALSNSPLIKLDLSHNKIEMLDKNSLRNLSSLQWLDLSHNSIGIIEELSFQSMLSLSHLILSDNLLTAESFAKNSFFGPINVAYLSLSHNKQLTTLPSFKWAGFEQTNLKSLDLSFLKLTSSIKAFTFYGLNNLEMLNLSFCGLTDLDPGWLNEGPENTVRTLDLSFNELTAVRPHYFVAIDGIKSFFSCPLYPQQSVDNVSKTRSLVVKNHEEYYRNLTHLSWISLKHNYKLKHLNNNAFNFVPNLRFLFLQDCNISLLTLAASEVLYNEHAIEKTLPNLRGLWIFGNPLNCDCRIRSVLEGSIPENKSDQDWTNCGSNLTSSNGFLVDSQTYYYDNSCRTVAGNLRSFCSPFKNFRCFALNEIPNKYLSCPEEPMIFLIAVIIGPFAFISSIFMAVICGYCSITFSRLHRNRIDNYEPYRHQPRPVNRGNLSSKYLKNRSNTAKRYTTLRNGTDGSITPRNDLRFQTNLVLRHMNSVLGSNQDANSSSRIASLRDHTSTRYSTRTISKRKQTTAIPASVEPPGANRLSDLHPHQSLRHKNFSSNNGRFVTSQSTLQVSKFEKESQNRMLPFVHEEIPFIDDDPDNVKVETGFLQ